MKNKTFWGRKPVIGIALSAAAMLLFGLLQVPSGLTREGLLSVGLFLSAIILWVTEAFPICVSAIGLIVLMPLFNIMSYNDAMGRFSAGTVLFIMATGGITITLTRTTIPLRITANILRLTKGDARLIILGFSLAGALLSGIMSSLATCALFFGIVNTMLKTAGCEPGQSQLGKALMIALPVCCGIGGFRLMDEGRTPLEYIGPPYRAAPDPDHVRSPDFQFHCFFLHSSMGFLWGKLYRRSFLNAHEIRVGPQAYM